MPNGKGDTHLKGVLCLSSEVSYGAVGLSAGRFVLQRLGIDVWGLATIQLPTHPGHAGPAQRTARPPTETERLFDHLDTLHGGGFLGGAEALLSGYLAHPDQARVLDRALKLIRAEAPNAPIVLDPIFGDDDTGIYVDPALPTLWLEEFLPQGDILVPNRFELAHLTGHEVTDPQSAVAACRHLVTRYGRAGNPPAIIASSIPCEEGKTGTVLLTGARQGIVRTPAFSAVPHGTGDCLAALVLDHFLQGRPLTEAVSYAVSSVYALCADAVARDLDELPLIDLQEALIAPPEIFALDPII
ncbi:MAG: PfkB family carbohydrate kinase [Pseudomonadota bacterium]